MERPRGVGGCEWLGIQQYILLNAVHKLSQFKQEFLLPEFGNNKKSLKKIMRNSSTSFIWL